MARPTKFKKEFITKLEEYFDIEPNFLKEILIETSQSSRNDFKEFASNLPTIQGFCYSIGITRDTFYSWVNDGENKEYKGKDKRLKKEFSDTYRKCKENQESIWLQNSLKGLYSPAFAIFLGKNVFDYKDKTEQEVTTKLSLVDLHKKNEDK